MIRKLPEPVRLAILKAIADDATAKAAARMTATEAEYARRLDNDALVRSWRFEPVTFVLARGCTYTPDFEVVRHSGKVEYHEVKGGHVWDDAAVKFKVAAEIFQTHRWVWAQKKPRGGGWQIRGYEPLDRERPRCRPSKAAQRANPEEERPES